MKNCRAILITAALLVSGSANAGIINGDFSNGLTNWNAETSNGGFVNIIDGKAWVTADAELTYTTQVYAGDELAYDWQFFSLDFLPYNDTFNFIVNDENGNNIFTELLADVAGTGWNQTTGQQQGTYTFLTTGIVSFGVNVYNSLDQTLDSRAWVDNWTIESNYTPPPTNVPEPSSLAILALGLLGLGARKLAA